MIKNIYHVLPENRLSAYTDLPLCQRTIITQSGQQLYLVHLTTSLWTLLASYGRKTSETLQVFKYERQVCELFAYSLEQSWG